MTSFLLTNADILSMDPERRRFQAMAVENGRIKALGTAMELAPLADSGLPVLDMGGATVLPGFIDSHQHLGLTGQTLMAVDLSKTTSLGQVYDLLASRRDGTAAGEWITGCTLFDLNIREKRMPTRQELDGVSTVHPIAVIHACWHLVSLNTMALGLLNLPPRLPGLDLEGGIPTGVVRDPGALSHVFPAMNRLRDTSLKLGGFKAAAQEALRRGITTLNCLEGGEYGPGEAGLLLDNLQDIPLNCVVWNQTMDLGESLALGLPRIGGCICADGAIDARTAALFEPYDDSPGNRGTLNFSQQRMDAFILEAHKAGLQIAVHCESEASIEQVLSAMEKAQQVFPRTGHRHRIEHFEVPAPDQLGRMAELQAIASMQPAFIPYLVDMAEYEAMLGPERLRMLHPYRSLLEAGVRVAGGSDCPVTPHFPLKGIQALLTHPIEDERISLDQALAAFTLDGAYAVFAEERCGSLTPGRDADLAVLDRDPFATPEDRLDSIAVLATVVGGTIHDFRGGAPQSDWTIQP